MSIAAPATAGRGGTPVGHVGTLPHVEAAMVRFLRLWCAGPSGQADVWNAAAAALGAPGGRNWLGAFEQMVGVMAGHARRPLVRHAPGCPCLGADECAIATLVAAAAEDAREDALMLAMVLVRPDIAPALTALAQMVGLGLRRMKPGFDAVPARAADATRH